MLRKNLVLLHSKLISTEFEEIKPSNIDSKFKNNIEHSCMHKNDIDVSDRYRQKMSPIVLNVTALITTIAAVHHLVLQPFTGRAIILNVLYTWLKLSPVCLQIAPKTQLQ